MNSRMVNLKHDPFLSLAICDPLISFGNKYLCNCSSINVRITKEPEATLE
jgi:hypothetical protein